jgi:cell division protein FtsB
MQANIKLLEERVLQVVERLRELSAERKQLESELRSLREHVESVEQGKPAASARERKDWRSQKAVTIDVIRRTIAELREA